MKTKITKNQLSCIGRVVIVPDGLNIFSGLGISPNFYNSGVYGWNWDAWVIDGIVFVDGYRSFPKADGEVTYEKAYELRERARKIWSMPNYEEEKKLIINDLINNII